MKNITIVALNHKAVKTHSSSKVRNPILLPSTILRRTGFHLSQCSGKDHVGFCIPELVAVWHGELKVRQSQQLGIQMVASIDVAAFAVTAQFAYFVKSDSKSFNLFYTDPDARHRINPAISPEHSRVAEKVVSAAGSN